MKKDFIASLEAVPEKAGWVKVPKSDASFGSLFNLIASEETRKRIKQEHEQQLVKENIPLIEELISKRNEQAKLLGYSSYSQMVLRPMMAKDINTVQTFLDDIRIKITPQAIEEIKTVNAVKAENKTVSDMTIKDWDFQYYQNEYDLRLHEGSSEEAS